MASVVPPRAVALLAVALLVTSSTTVSRDSARPPAAGPGFLSESSVGGVFALTEKARDGWGWSGAWRFPVGDPRDFSAPGQGGEPAFRLLRGWGTGGAGADRHDGADLGCGRSGAPVRAAAGGLVLIADRIGYNNGYGLYVTLGHRLPEGGVAYSIYAHLAEGSIVVRPGQTVAAGDRLGRVGRTGRATTPHLHFEVRMAAEPGLRWEHEAPANPVDFVTARLAAPFAPNPLGPYVEWALYSGLFAEPPDPAAPLEREHWWRILAVTARHDLVALPPEPAALAESLVAAGVLPESPRPSARSPLAWSDIARDLERIRDLGHRLPARPLADPGHRALCEEWLGTRTPLKAPERAAKLEAQPPTVARALLAVADLAPAPEPPRPPKRKPRSAPSADTATVARRAAVASQADSASAATRAPASRAGRAAGVP